MYAAASLQQPGTWLPHAAVVADSRLVRAHIEGRCLTLRLGNRLAALEPASQALRSFLQDQGVDPRGIYDADLVFEEIFANTVRHGYPDAVGHDIETRCEVTASDIRLQFSDHGRPFDPTAREMPPAPLRLADAPTGGWGLVMVRKKARDLEYRREGARNRLSLRLPRS